MPTYIYKLYCPDALDIHTYIVEQVPIQYSHFRRLISCKYIRTTLSETSSASSGILYCAMIPLKPSIPMVELAENISVQSEPFSQWSTALQPTEPIYNHAYIKLVLFIQSISFASSTSQRPSSINSLLSDVPVEKELKSKFNPVPIFSLPRNTLIVPITFCWTDENGRG